MRGTMGKLTTKDIKDAPAGKKLGDGDGLWFVVTAPERGKWVLRYQVAYKSRELGLGGYPLVTIPKARAAALEARRLVHSGVDPIDEKHKTAIIIPTFGKFAESVVEAQTEGTSAGHARQFANSLAAYAASIADKPVNAITTEHVLAVLAPIWHEKAETARRVRNRIERVLDAAKAKGLRNGDNPAALKGNLAHLLGKQQKRGDLHHAALDYSAVPGFVAKLRERGDTRAMALEFIILTAVRLSEAIDAKWSEIDLDGRLWTIPADRMKAGKEHRVPLSDRACQILAAMQIERRGARVFNISVRTIQNLVAAMDEKATTHGMRSAFRDWCGDVAHAPREIAEEALAHAIGSQTERAYRRGDALDQRRALMDAWASYVAAEAGANVVDLASRRA
jgi:integrase